MIASDRIKRNKMHSSELLRHIWMLVKLYDTKSLPLLPLQKMDQPRGWRRHVVQPFDTSLYKKRQTYTKSHAHVHALASDTLHTDMYIRGPHSLSEGRCWIIRDRDWTGWQCKSWTFWRTLEENEIETLYTFFQEAKVFVLPFSSLSSPVFCLLSIYIIVYYRFCFRV